MSKYKIEIRGRADRIEYTTEDGKKIIVYVDLWGGVPDHVLKLKDLVRWEPPFENEEISIAEKQEILTNISKEENSNGENPKIFINVDLSPESNNLNREEILNELEFDYNITIEMNTRRQKAFNEMSDNYHKRLDLEIPYYAKNIYQLNEEEYRKLKQDISENKNLQWVLESYSKWKVNEDLGNLDQRKFTSGLYALDMALVNNNKEEIKEILKKYKDVSKIKNLSFDEFMSKNRPLNELIKEIL